MQFRVANTGSGASHVANEFGYDLRQFGNLTPDQVHAAARHAKLLDLQRQMAAAMKSHLEKIFQNKVEIERLTLEALKSGLKAKEEIDKYVLDAAVASAKHDAHIQKLDHQLKQELNLVQAQSLSDKALQTQSFQQRLRLLQASHQAKSQIQATGFAQRLKEIQASPALAQQQQQARAAFTSYINAKEFNPYAEVGTGSGSSRSPASASGGKRGGFLGGLVSFFTGR